VKLTLKELRRLVNEALDDEATHGQLRLGRLYDELVSLAGAGLDRATWRGELLRLQRTYGASNVAFMLRTVRDDSTNV